MGKVREVPTSGVAGDIVEGARCLQTRIEDLEKEVNYLRRERKRLKGILDSVDEALSDAFFDGHEVGWEKIPSLPGYEKWLERIATRVAQTRQFAEEGLNEGDGEEQWEAWYESAEGHADRRRR